MKFTLSWLKEHLETDADTAIIAETLTAVGLEIEEVVDRAAALAPFRVAHVVKAEQHPNADRLKVCTVDTGETQVQVVCGAPNARTGMKGVFAPPGSHVPGTGLDLVKGVIRGVESNGMLLSERELGLSDEHSGIIELPDDAAVGTPYATLAGLDDPVFDIALTPDRADCAAIRGVARDLAAAGLGTLKPDPLDPVPAAYPCPIAVEIAAPPAEGPSPCPMFVGRHFRGVRNGPSPAWLQERLTAVGLRPISALVDITNFFTLDRARPLHVFDAAKLAGTTIDVRLSQGGETLEALNDKTYTLEPGMTGVCDGAGVAALGGVIGGTRTGVSDATTEVFLEAALFDPIRTARTGRALSIDSDARYRFERGVDPDAVFAGVERATRMILELCGGEASDLVVAGAVPEWRRTVDHRPSRVAALGGVAVPEDEQRHTLIALGFTAEPVGEDLWRLDVPSWRADIAGEADIVEEVLRIAGYDRIPSTPLPPLSHRRVAAVTDGQATVARTKRLLAARGLDECVTWSFMAREVTERAFPQDTSLRLLNPIASDLDVMRPSILPNLIQAAARNAARGLADAGLFEVGPVYRDSSPKGQPTVAAVVRSGMTGPRHWAAQPRPVDVFDAKADALAVLEAAGAPVANLQTTPDAPGWYHPGRSGVLRLGANVLAQFGEGHPTMLDALGASGPFALCEVFLDAVPLPKRKGGTARPLLALSPLQPLTRDLAFVVADQVAADAVLRAARAAEKTLVTDAGVFDVYRGAGVPEGSKSLAIWVRLQPTEATLSDAEIDAVMQRIVAQVGKQTGATLRG